MALEDRLNPDDVVGTTVVVDQDRLKESVERFGKEFRLRSFYGRHPEIGKMIKCALCGLRHRATQCHMTEQKFANKPGTPEGESNPMIATGKNGRPIGNPFWRARPGLFLWIKGLNKFVRIVR